MLDTLIRLLDLGDKLAKPVLKHLLTTIGRLLRFAVVSLDTGGVPMPPVARCVLLRLAFQLKSPEKSHQFV